ncbi:MAG TPA: CHRD domain-containing protein [Actinomycetota bacterium]|nr:CHRD domain-containing protein [Actinomycetota bacterium]
MRRRTMLALGTVALATVLAFLAVPGQAGIKGGFKARLTGYQETPSISTGATGQFRARVNPAETEISFELSWSGLEGGDAAAAHIHLGQPGVAGGVVITLCGSPKPACPTGASASISGTLTASDVQALPAQGIAVGELAEVLRAMRRGFTYVNVHTATFPGGEIRGQIRR